MQNKDMEGLRAAGGVEGLAARIGSNTVKGLDEHGVAEST